MLKAAIFIALASHAGRIDTKVNLDLFNNDQKVASGTYEESIDRHGHKRSEFKITWTDDLGVKSVLVQTKMIDDHAYPISEEETITSEGDDSRGKKVLRVKYDDSGAAILTVIKDHKKYTTERTYVPKSGYSRADTSDLWFSKYQPAVGTTVTSTVFDIENAHWQIVETTYVGKKWVTVSGRRVRANEVRDVRDGTLREVYLDDKGMPVLMITGPYRTVKRFKE